MHTILSAVLTARVTAGTNTVLSMELPASVQALHFKKNAEKYTLWGQELSAEFLEQLNMFLKHDDKFFNSKNPERGFSFLPISAFVGRFLSLQHGSTNLFIFAMVYLDRLFDASPCLMLTKWNFHALAFGTICLAAKYHDDISHSMKTLAEIGGVSVKDACIIEQRILKELNYQCFVTEQEFHSMEVRLTAESLDTERNVECFTALLDGNISHMEEAMMASKRGHEFFSLEDEEMTEWDAVWA